MDGVKHQDGGLMMNARNEALLEQAKQHGYLVMRYGHNSTLQMHYFRWCQSQKIPAISVWFHGASASFDTNTEPVFLGYYDEPETEPALAGSPDFTPTPELQERLRILSSRCLASVSRRNSEKAWIFSGGGMMASYIGQEMAIEAAQELWDIWQEAKNHLVFMPE
ncbi:MAG: hypothetical protein ACRDIV_07895 [Ktedonobacteraceae bacterium]